MISQTSSNKHALIFSNEKVTFKELNELISLKEKQAKKEEVIFLKAQSDKECIISILSALSAQVPLVIYSEELDKEQEAEVKKKVLSHRVKEKTALILFTSGSSGDSKCVQLSLENIEANTQAIIKGLDFNEIDSQVLFLPLSYSFGLLGQLLPALYLGKTTYVIDHILKVRKIVEEYKVQMISGVPSQHIVIQKILKEFSSITHVVSAGAPLNLSLRESLVQSYKNAVIYNNYGQTELSPRALILSSKDESFMSMATGRVVEGLEYKITEESEILFKGKQVMLGYLEEDESKVIDGWLHTGDLAFEKDNIVYISGRKDSLVNIAGQRVNLKFLERVIEAEKDVIDCAALVEKNELYGQELFIFYSGTLKKEDVLAVYKLKGGLKVVPKKITQLKQLPKNTNGKKDYPLLKKNL